MPRASAARRLSFPRFCARVLVAGVAVGAAGALAPAAARAQQPQPEATSPGAGTPPPVVRLPRTFVAVNALGAVLGVLSGEVEHAFTPSLGVGVGASHWSLLDDRVFSYTSADLRLRYYASAAAPTGLSVGAVAGLTRVSSRVIGQSVDALGTGVELSYGELAGRDRRLFLGVGAGLKRLVPLRKELEGFRVTYPTARASIGLAF